MTLQHTDTFAYQGKPANVIAISEDFTFSPYNDFGIETGFWSTSNRRGFWCDYSIDGSLMVQNLYLFSHDKNYPFIMGQQAEKIPMYVELLDTINGRTGEKYQYINGFPMQYIDINYDVDYLGKIVLGTGATKDKQGQRAYKQVLELSFEDGIIVRTKDITEAWRYYAKNEKKNVDKHWWTDEKRDYYYLINYHFMGC